MAFKLAAVVAGLSHDDFLQEWNWCWIAQDVEAAAELGRTLLERNRELESTVRQQQAVIDDQTMEMEYLSKQNRLLRQAAESRLRLCEQLEASVAECERAKVRTRHHIEAQRQRNIILKTNLEAAEERGDHLQRLLDASRVAESQSRSQLRSLQKQRQLAITPVEEEPPKMMTPFWHQSVECRVDEHQPQQEEEVMKVCRLVNDLAEVEERLHLMETDWMEERRKRIHLEAEMATLQQENQRQQSIISISPSLPASSLSLSEELLISSSTDFSSAQWRDAWDHNGPLSLIGSSSKDDELCSDSSSSGFCDESRSVAKATQTDLQHVIDSDPAEVYSLFRQIFHVIKQNI